MTIGHELPTMPDLSNREREVLNHLAEGRVNPMYLRDETGMDKGDINTVLVKLSRDGYARRIARGLYEITEHGLETVEDEETSRDATEEYVREYVADDPDPNVRAEDLAPNIIDDLNRGATDDFDELTAIIRRVLDERRGETDAETGGTR